MALLSFLFRGIIDDSVGRQSAEKEGFKDFPSPKPLSSAALGGAFFVQIPLFQMESLLLLLQV
jgi:hypothetical protein